MKNKVINLFGDKNIVQNQGIKYSELLEKFISHFASDFHEVEYYEDVIDFAISAWNFGNMNIIIPKKDFKQFMSTVSNDDVDIVLLNKMIDYKVVNFREHSNFIVDYEVSEKDSNPLLTVATQESETYLAAMTGNFKEDFEESDFEENYINRSAIILKPLQPFLDWCSNLHFEYTDETNTYLISEDIDDVEAWIKKKFDKLFMLELEGWHDNKKEWPQKRNYKMFKQWFQVDISTMVYDLENELVSK